MSITKPVFLIAAGRRLHLFIDPDSIIESGEDEEVILSDGTVYTTEHYGIDITGSEENNDSMLEAALTFIDMVINTPEVENNGNASWNLEAARKCVAAAQMELKKKTTKTTKPNLPCGHFHGRYGCTSDECKYGIDPEKN